MYDNLGSDENERHLKKIGEAGPINWQQGAMCQFIGWKRFSNSTWEKQQVQQKIDEIRISLDLPKTLNRFMAHTLITLLLSVIIFIVALLIPDDWSVVKTVGIWQLVAWSLVYLIWPLVLLKIMRSKIRKGFRDIETSIPELRLQFSVYCDCICGCINQNYITIYFKE